MSAFSLTIKIAGNTPYQILFSFKRMKIIPLTSRRLGTQKILSVSLFTTLLNLFTASTYNEQLMLSHDFVCWFIILYVYV